MSEEQIGKLMDEYYNSIPKGRALHELRFALQQHLEKINFALSYENREDLIRDKEITELKLKCIRR